MLSDWCRALLLANDGIPLSLSSLNTNKISIKSCVWLDFYDVLNDRWLVGRGLQLLLPTGNYGLPEEKHRISYLHQPIGSPDRNDNTWQLSPTLEWSSQLWSALEMELHPNRYSVNRRAQPIVLIQPLATTNQIFHIFL